MNEEQFQNIINAIKETDMQFYNELKQILKQDEIFESLTQSRGTSSCGKTISMSDSNEFKD